MKTELIIPVVGEEKWKHVQRNNDVTLYWPTDNPPTFPGNEGLIAVRADLEKTGLVDSQVKLIQFSVKGTATGASAIARGNIVFCNSGRNISGTFRITERYDAQNFPASPKANTINRIPFRWHLNPEHLIPAEIHAEHVSDIIQRDPFHALTGLVVIAGSTGCGKSDLARAFIKCLLDKELTQLKPRSKKRFPHLVSFEDPIENWATITNGSGIETARPELSLDHGICLTARELNSDARSLFDVLQDARRQTPVCVYVSETRIRRDWKSVLDFAGSGHLIVVTTHASSLTETMLRIISASRASTPALRRQCAGVIRAIIHLKPVQINGLQTRSFADTGLLSHSTGKKSPPLPHTFSAILPSLWISTPATLSAIVCPGLSSMIPNRLDILSRCHYVDSLLGRTESRIHNCCEPQTVAWLNRIALNAKPLHKAAATVDVQELTS
jgi:hypothetical protein